ncbi:MAG: dUTP diphosphatase [Oligoflexia bacterium]|nr:dUTP diphosphatase [Oligoflexia bacterium]
MANRKNVKKKPAHWLRPETVRILRVEEGAVLPTRAHPDDAGMDLYSLEDVELVPGQGQVVKTGIALALPEGYVGLVADRSSLAKRGVKTAGGIIDAGYRGQVHIVLWNISNAHVALRRHERIAQLLILPVGTPAVVEVSSLDGTARGEKGFGSSGR